MRRNTPSSGMVTVTLTLFRTWPTTAPIALATPASAGIAASASSKAAIADSIPAPTRRVPPAADRATARSARFRGAGSGHDPPPGGGGVDAGSIFAQAGGEDDFGRLPCHLVDDHQAHRSASAAIGRPAPSRRAAARAAPNAQPPRPLALAPKHMQRIRRREATDLHEAARHQPVERGSLGMDAKQRIKRLRHRGEARKQRQLLPGQPGGIAAFRQGMALNRANRPSSRPVRPARR